MTGRIDTSFPTQEKVMAWVRRQGFSETIEARTMKLAEEAGEVVGAVVKIPEGRKTMDDLAQELAQLVICAMGVAQAADMELWHAVEEEWERMGLIRDHAWVGVAGHPDDWNCSVCGEFEDDHAESTR